MTVDADIVFVGSGPIGLWTAIQTKALNPKQRIVMLDKYEGYQRTQVLRIVPSSFFHLANVPELRALQRSWVKQRFVPIQEMETSLKAVAEKKGIVCQVQNVEDTAILKEQFPRAKHIVGSDGYHSVVREQVFQGNLSSSESVQHIVQLSYEVKGKTRTCNKIENHMLRKWANTYTHEHVGRPKKDGVRRVQVRFFVSQEEYEALQDSRAKDPWSVEDTRIPKKLQERLQFWLRARRDMRDEEQVGVPRVTAIRLNNYAAKLFARMDEKNPDLCWSLVGDAASGVPFQRSINKGFKEGAYLARVLAGKKMPWMWRLLARIFRSSAGRGVNLDMRAYALSTKASFRREQLLSRIRGVIISFFKYSISVRSRHTPHFLRKIYVNLLFSVKRIDYINMPKEV